MAVVSSAWAKPGSWALDAESIDESVPATEFPSLAAAVSTKVPKKKKPQTLSLAEFTNGPAKPIVSTRLTHDEMLALPTGPRERSAEELDRPRGFGFSSYNSGGAGSDRNRSGDDESGRRGGMGSRDNGPSRADEADDWGKMKKSSVPERRGGGFHDSNQNPSRADDSDRWTSNKRDVLPTMQSDSRRSGSNSWGFNKERDLTGDTWGKRREEPSSGGFNKERDMDGDTWGRKREEPSNGGTSNGTRPRLVLQPRTLPIVIESNDLTPQSDQLSDTGSSGKGNKVSNPFGAARPREEVLAEKGQDWRKIDEKLESAKLEEKPTFGSKKILGSNGNVSEARTESAWRKPLNLVETPATRSENGEVEKAEQEGTVEI